MGTRVKVLGRYGEIWPNIVDSVPSLPFLRSHIEAVLDDEALRLVNEAVTMLPFQVQDPRTATMTTAMTTLTRTCLL